MQEDADSVTVELRGRGTPRAETLRVQRVIRASGFTEVATAQSRLVERLVARGLVRFDSLGISFDVGDDLRVRDAQGRTATPLWALGPVVRGAFWECTSVPDIRHQAKAVAQSVLHESMRVA